MASQLTKNLTALKKKEVKEVLSMISEQWGFEEKLDYIFLENKEGKIFIVNNDITQIDFEKIRINSAGLYIAKITNNQIRLSVEGTQIIGPHAKKNITEISDKLARLWMKGYDIPYDEEKGKALKGPQIIRNNDDFLGTGIFKENRLLNFVPKSRVISSAD